MDKIQDICKTEEARINFILGCARVACSDGVLDDSEMDFIQHISLELEISLDKIEYIQSCMSSNSFPEITFQTKRESLYLIKEAIQISCIDSNYCEQEKNEVRNIATELNLAKEDVSRIENWVFEGMTWAEEGNRLISELAGE